MVALSLVTYVADWVCGYLVLGAVKEICQESWCNAIDKLSDAKQICLYSKHGYG